MVDTAQQQLAAQQKQLLSERIQTLEAQKKRLDERSRTYRFSDDPITRKQQAKDLDAEMREITSMLDAYFGAKRLATGEYTTDSVLEYAETTGQAKLERAEARAAAGVTQQEIIKAKIAQEKADKIANQTRKQEQIKIQPLAPNVISSRQEAIKIQEESKKIPSVISAAEDPTLKSTFSFFKTNILRDPKKALVGSAGMLKDVVTKPIGKEREITEETKKILSGETTQPSFYQNVKGTEIKDTSMFPTTITFTKERSDAEIVRDTRFIPEARLRALGTRLGERTTQELVKDINAFQKPRIEELNRKVETGEIKTQAQLDKAIKSLEGDTAREIERLSNTQKYKDLDDANTKALAKAEGRIMLSETISNLPIIVGAGLLTGGVASAIAATGTAGATAVTIGGAATGAYTGTQAALYFEKNLAAGTLTKEKLISFGIDIGAFVAGAKGGSKLMTGSAVSDVKLKNVLDTADLKINSKSLIKEVDVKSLAISEANKVEVTGRLKAGQTARIVEADLVAQTAEGQKILNKGLPERKIRFIEITDSLGNLVDRIAIGQIEVKKGLKVYKQDVLTKSKGAITDAGVLETETLTLLGKEGKKIDQAILTREKTFAGVKKRGLIKFVKSQTGVKLIEEIKAGKRKPITQAQIKNLFLSENKGRKISQAEFLEIQRVSGLEFDVMKLRDKGLEKLRNKALLVRKETRVGKGEGISAQVLELPKISKKSKPFINEKILENNFKTRSGRIDKRIKQDLKQVEKINQDFPTYTGGESLDVGIKQTLARGAGSASFDVAVRRSLGNIKQPKGINLIAPIGLEVAGQRGKLEIDQLFNTDKLLKQRGKTFQITDLKLDQNTLNKQFNDIMNFQDLEQALKLRIDTKPYSPQAPNIPNIPIPKIPTIDIFDFEEIEDILRPEGAKKQSRKLSKGQSRYTASLSEAALGRNVLEVTEKQLKELNKKVFSGFERRPVLKLKQPK